MKWQKGEREDARDSIAIQVMRHDEITRATTLFRPRINKFLEPKRSYTVGWF